MKTKVGTILGLVIASLVTAAWTGMDEPVKLGPSSQLWVEGKSTMKDWKCVAEVMQGAIEAVTTEPAPRVLAGEKAITTVGLSIPVEKLNCNNSNTMNGHMKKALKATENPVIEFRLISYELSAADAGRKGTLNGTLRIGGVEKPIVLSVDLMAGAEGGLRVKGTYVMNMTDFGLKPPSLMLGTMKVKDQVTVGFDLLLDK